MPNPTPLRDLANFMNKQVIPCIEVTLASLKPDIKRGTGEYGEYAYQSGSFKDAQGGSAYFSFSGNDDCFFKNSDVGTKIRIECGTDKKGAPAGLVWGVRQSGDKTYTTINLDNRATISYLNEQGSSPSQGATTQGRAVSVRSGGVLDDSPLLPSTATVGERIVHWFQIYDLVKNHAPRGFPDGELKDVTTTIFLSYKAKYSVHADPIFDRPNSGGHAKDQGGAEWPNDDSDQIPFAPAWKSLGSGVF